MGDGGVVTGRACAVRLLVAPVALPGSATGLVHGSASRGPTTRGAAPARGPAAPVLDRYRALNQGPATDQRCIPVANPRRHVGDPGRRSARLEPSSPRCPPLVNATAEPQEEPSMFVGL